MCKSQFGINTHIGKDDTHNHDESLHNTTTNVSLIEFHHPTATWMALLLLLLIAIVGLWHYCWKKRCRRREAFRPPSPMTPEPYYSPVTHTAIRMSEIADDAPPPPAARGKVLTKDHRKYLPRD